MEKANLKCEKDLKLGKDNWNWKSKFVYASRLWTKSWRAQYAVSIVPLTRPAALSMPNAKDYIYGLLQERAVEAPEKLSALDMYPPPFQPSGGRRKGENAKKEKKEQRRKTRFAETAPSKKNKTKSNTK